MKKLVFALFLVLGLAFTQNAHAQKHKKSYRYYPEANVYYNNETHQYAYSDNGNWGYQKNLPKDVRVNRRSYVTVYGDQDDIWRNNQMHREKYKDWGKRHKDHDRDRDRDRDKDRDRDDRH